MDVDRYISPDLSAVARDAKVADDGGCDAIWMPEANHDVFLLSLLAADATQEVDIGTNIAVAFSRNPMSTAYSAWDLNAHAGGRFVLGLGSQVKPHIERRFSMPWSRPARRMREFVQALRAIWDAWQQGTALEFRGEFYTHTVMNPMFDPGPTESGAPKVFIAGVGPAMTRVAGEVADGLHVHPLTSERYLREVTVPAVEAGLAASGRSRKDFELHCPVLTVTGETFSERQAVAAATRRLIAFYGSTPPYLPVLETHGWGKVHTELHGLSKQGAWDTMAELVDDEMLNTFAVVADPEDLGARVAARFGGVADRVSVYPQCDGLAPRAGEEAVLAMKDGDASVG